MLSKKGVSPVVATVLLISLALVAGTIIIIWGTSVIKEETLKFEGKISDICSELDLDVSLNGDTLDVSNLGSRAALHSLTLRANNGDLHECNVIDISPGEARSYNTNAECGAGISGSDVEAIIPVLKSDDETTYNCVDNEINNF